MTSSPLTGFLLATSVIVPLCHTRRPLSCDTEG